MNLSATPAAGYLSGQGGMKAWYSSRDHKKVGLLFLVWTSSALLLGAIFGLFMVIKSIGGRGLEPRFMFEMLTYHRLFLFFLFLVPALPAVLGHFLLPLQLGARNMALPGLSVWSLRSYATGLVLVLLSIFFGPIATGWTLASPLSVAEPGAFGLVALGLFFMAVSWFMVGVNIIVTVHDRRAPGMGFFDMPIFSWSLYLSAYQLVVAGAVFGIVILYLAIARSAGKGLFGPDTDPLLWSRYFWFVASPAAVCSLLPAVGAVSEVIAGISRKGVAGYRMVVGAMIALLGLSFTTYGVQMAGLGQDPTSTLVFSFLGTLAALPAALIAYSLLATLYQGAISGESPAVFVFAFLLQAGIACMMGLVLASPGLGSYLGMTMFASTQYDYLIWGGVLTALMAGLHYWWPLMTGRVLNQEVAKIGAILYVIGVNMALLPQIFLGTRGVTRDMGAFEPGPTGVSELSALGWLFLYSGLGVVAANLISTMWSGERAPANPWGASTLEWQAGSPPPGENFADDPEAGPPYRF
jgi:cytochrome c oxidase subunit 1